MINTYKETIFNIVFIALFVIISLGYHYNKILFLHPQSLHQWRQTDCLSIALNYYQDGMNFFKPEVHNLFSDKWTTGYSAGEFPGIYFLVAMLSLRGIFKKQDWHLL